MIIKFITILLFAVSLAAGSSGPAAAAVPVGAGDVLLAQDRDQTRLVDPIKLYDRQQDKDQLKDQDKDQIHQDVQLLDTILLQDQLRDKDQLFDKIQDRLHLQDCGLDCDKDQDKDQDQDQDQDKTRLRDCKP